MGSLTSLWARSCGAHLFVSVSSLFFSVTLCEMCVDLGIIFFFVRKGMCLHQSHETFQFAHTDNAINRVFCRIAECLGNCWKDFHVDDRDGVMFV